jgi:hypothetical protein
MNSDIVFVFGSNEAGRHGKGAALTALKEWGAVYGQGEGRYGASYAIPTKDGLLRTLPVLRIKQYVDTFLQYAKEHPDLTFLLTRVGCGLAGYDDGDMAPLFSGITPNVILPDEWKSYIRKSYDPLYVV